MEHVPGSSAEKVGVYVLGPVTTYPLSGGGDVGPSLVFWTRRASVLWIRRSGERRGQGMGEERDQVIDPALALQEYTVVRLGRSWVEGEITRGDDGLAATSKNRILVAP
jgi:hypothetical protein